MSLINSVVFQFESLFANGPYKTPPDTSCLEIKWAFGIFNCQAFYGVSIDHCGSDIAVPEQFLDRADIIICLEQVTGKAVPEGMG